MLPKMRGWLLDDQPASTVFEELRILAAFRIGHQGPLGCQIFLISLPIPSVDLVSPTFVAPTAVNDSLPRRRRHHLGTILSASRPVCRKTGNFLREGCAPEEVASLYAWGQSCCITETEPVIQAGRFCFLIVGGATAAPAIHEAHHWKIPWPPVNFGSCLRRGCRLTATCTIF